MENAPKRPKGMLITAWIISALTFVVVAPMGFIAGVFSSDNTTGATSLVSYLFIIAPFSLLVFPIVAQMAYKRGKNAAAFYFSIASIAWTLALIAYIASIFIGIARLQ